MYGKVVGVQEVTSSNPRLREDWDKGGQKNTKKKKINK